MADRTLTFSLSNVSVTTTWKRVRIYQNGNYVDTLTGTPTTGTGSTTVQITGLNLTGEEKIKKAVVTSSYSVSGTPTNGSFSMNGSGYAATKRIDPSEIKNNTAFKLTFAFKADGNSGTVSGGGNTVADFSCTRTVTNIKLTVTIGTGNAFDGQVSSLDEGAKIILTEASGTGTYTLVQHEYNTGKAMLFRDASIGTSKYQSSEPSSYYYNKFEDSALDKYINTTWYGGLPANTKTFLSPLNYKICLNNYLTATTISRNACTISDSEHSTGSEDWGSPLSYAGTLSLDTVYWTRTPVSGMAKSAHVINASNGISNASVTVAQKVRPTLGVLETQLVKPTTNGYIFCTKCTAPTTVKINNGTSNITNTQSQTTCTLSWSGAAAGTNAPITGYAVWYSTSANGTYNLYGTTTSTSMTVVGPEKGFSTYYFKVQTLSEEEIDYCNSNLSSTSRAISTKNSNLYYYDGTRWLIGLPKYWNGSAWVEGNSTNYYNGSSWKKPI